MLLILGSRDQEGRAASRRLLALGLREVWGVENVPPMERGPMGKPFFPAMPHIHFNLSHSGDLALCALSDRPVGVDIERVRPHRAGLPRYALSDREYRWFLAQGGGWELFCRLWTRKACCWTTSPARAGGRLCAPPGRRRGSSCGETMRRRIKHKNSGAFLIKQEKAPLLFVRLFPRSN